MCLSSLKFSLLIALFITYGSVINGFSKRVNLNEENESLPEAEGKLSEALSTMESVLKEMDEKLEEDIQKEEDQVLDKEESKEEEETGDAENKETLEELVTKLTKEIEEKEEEMIKSVTEEIERLNEIVSPKSTLDEENEAASPASPMLVTELSIEKETAPKDTFAVWNAQGKICLLARLHVMFSVTYPSKGGEQKSEVPVPTPAEATTKGKCETTSKSPLLQVSWQKYAFTMIFNKTEEDNWIVTAVELTYDTSDPIFDRATNPGKKTARSKPVSLFETPMKKSFYCPAQEVVLMYSGNKHVVTARLKDIYLQPYGIEDGQFSEVQRCSKVVIDGPDETPYVQDETVPLAVGCTLALITLLILLGFSFHRAYNAAKVDYNTMQ